MFEVEILIRPGPKLAQQGREDIWNKLNQSNNNQEPGEDKMDTS